MLFDDRLATVLRHRASGERAARTQFRQLLDLLGRRQRGSDESLRAAAWLRLGALGEAIPASGRAEMIRDPALRFHCPELAAHFAEDEPAVAAAALGVAQLREDDWEALIPRLPIRARGFLRLRNDLPPGAIRLLDRLGISDRGLPEPIVTFEETDQNAEVLGETDEEAPVTDTPTLPPVPANDAAEPGEIAVETADAAQPTAIGTLVQRIEAFQRERAKRVGEKSGTTAAPPLLPTEEDAQGTPPLLGFAFTTDAVGRIDWAEPHVAPSVMHMAVPSLLPDSYRRAFMQRQTIDGAPITVEGAPVISGEWICEAAPRFTSDGGRFFGYAGRLRRPASAAASALAAGAAAPNAQSDGLRQLLHELRTPVNAIQGFAELIQQQLFGPVPHEYRALAANIAGDSARMLAGFDELDRLAKLESGALEMEPGDADHSGVIAAVSERLAAILEPRNAGFKLNLVEQIQVTLGQSDLEAMTWRMLAALAASMAPGEKIELTLVGDRDTSWLEVALPAALVVSDDIFVLSNGQSRSKSKGAASSGAFGPAFALRLARAEARAAGGDLARVDTRLVMDLPRLTDSEAEPSPATATGRAARSK
ncbi:histidine kinase dimerization/phospho-acceptor domain-containing protein [Qipengyuania sp. DSG2-2]|uniref:histidine kinase dimerization/phospho-acceptor domain-containing protein n=1 Tax=Qipengyuania sp. DGS2-2 TaxID=3349631 RepID=UPI0036D241DA